MGSYSMAFAPRRSVEKFFRDELSGVRQVWDDRNSHGPGPVVYFTCRRSIVASVHQRRSLDDPKLIAQGLYFLAVKNVNVKTGETYVEAAVCSYWREERELYWRIDWDCMGPGVLCPAAVLDALTPTPFKIARGWRQDSAEALGRAKQHVFWLGAQAA